LYWYRERLFLPKIIFLRATFSFKNIVSLPFLRAKKNLTGLKKPVRFIKKKSDFKKIGFLKALKFLTII